MTALPIQIPPAAAPCPIEARELAFTTRGAGGDETSTHLVHNGDLGVILGRGQEGRRVDAIPHNVEDTGLIVVSMGVDGGDHHEVHYSGGFGTDGLELLTAAVEALTACRDALMRVSQA